MDRFTAATPTLAGLLRKARLKGVDRTSGLIQRSTGALSYDALHR